jgi:hypothetical protein
MNELFEPANSSAKRVSASVEGAKQRLLVQVRQKPAKTVAVILVGSILLSVWLASRISRKQEESKQQRLVEDWMQEVMNWIRQNGQNIANPIKGGLEATRAAIGEVSQSSARVSRQVPSFLQKQKRTLLNLF